MKSKYLLLTLLASAGLIAADSTPPADAPAGGPGSPPAKGENPPAKGEKPDKKGGKAKTPPEGVSEADFKKLLDARKASANDPAVKAAQTTYDNAKKADSSASTEETKKALNEAKTALAEAQKAAVVKADPTLTDVANKVAEADKAKGGSKKKDKSHDGAAKPAKQ